VLQTKVAQAIHSLYSAKAISPAQEVGDSYRPAWLCRRSRTRTQATEQSGANTPAQPTSKRKSGRQEALCATKPRNKTHGGGTAARLDIAVKTPNPTNDDLRGYGANAGRAETSAQWRMRNLPTSMRAIWLSSQARKCRFGLPVRVRLPASMFAIAVLSGLGLVRWPPLSCPARSLYPADDPDQQARADEASNEVADPSP
jgi:hypothetical protein